MRHFRSSFQMSKISKKEVKNMSILDNFEILRNHVEYGSNSKTIFKHLVQIRDFDESKVKFFGSHKPLYAENADDSRKRDVWFICYPNYDQNKAIENCCEDYHVADCICKNGEYIIEVFIDNQSDAHDAERITFVKNKFGQYEFYGVYRLIVNGSSRIYKRISNTY